MRIMAGKSSVIASAAQRRDLIALSHSRDRGEADRARALLLTLAGWTSPRIAEAFGVREDTVRLWRSAFSQGGVDALRRSVAPGPAPVKAERALAVAEAVLSGSVADRPNWTLSVWSCPAQSNHASGATNTPGKCGVHAITQVIASRSYSSPERQFSKKALSRLTRSGQVLAARSPSDTP